MFKRLVGIALALLVVAVGFGWHALHNPAGAAPPPAVRAPHVVTVLETRRVVPSSGLPDLPLGAANNNLDVLRVGGRTFLAFRTAPSHYASADTRVHVVSSADELTWIPETTLSVGADLREPRLFLADGRVHLLVAQLGTDRFDFEPDRTLSVTRRETGAWTEPVTVRDDGFIPWRVRDVRGVPHLVGYTGGGGVYDFVSPRPVRIELLAWRSGTFAKLGRVLEGGGSEADFTLLADGSLFAVVRNERGDEAGFGSKLCRAPAHALTAWSCEPDPRKFDSPLVVPVDGEVYVIARRTLSSDGRYARGLELLPDAVERLAYEAAYITERKRCALFHRDSRSGELGFVLDLPSRGDTCFASVVPGASRDTLVVYDYSSPLEGGEDPAWVVGQHGSTHVYRHALRFHRR